MSNNGDVLARLEEVIKDRLNDAQHSKSYVASLAAKGTDAILKKIGEEATETVMAAKDADSEKIIYEVADLCFHTMIMLAHYDVSVEQVLEELDRRMGVSGLAEKAAR
ncbi:MAG: phosphoribosyl-ATP diphosphatase [Arenicella sp.]|jgi:phosphoribosyl-ATP pyrophosphohydrolase|nr:phosphoribosyl-ATP diphosphatase [bacterium]MDG1906167.1 phosphoribosyl-ATP diphosphatase [Arenicella sp.]